MLNRCSEKSRKHKHNQRFTNKTTKPFGIRTNNLSLIFAIQNLLKPIIFNDSMKGFSYMVFISEIVLQVKIAEQAEKRLPIDPGNFDQIEVWCSIQSILGAAGNVSKILWPQLKKSKERGEKLRELLGIAEKNIIADRKFRNHFEHYDDRIEKWFDNRSGGSYIDLAFNPFKPTPWDLPKFYHRAYNQVDRILTFRNETLDLKEVLEALKEIKMKCSAYTLL